MKDECGRFETRQGNTAVVLRGGRLPMIQIGDEVLVKARVSALDVSQSIDLEVEIDSGDGRKHVLDITSEQIIYRDGMPLTRRRAE